MSNFRFWQSSTAALTALTLTAGASAPLVMPAPAQAQVSFSDVVPNYWAGQFIQELANRRVLGGFPDGSFRPNDPVTRAQFAAMVRQAFSRSATRNAPTFRDVPATYWAASAIRDAYAMGFLSGYPENEFRPEENIPRAQVLVSLANGLGYSGGSSLPYSDAASIPDWARSSIAAATDKKIVVNYPNLQTLNPNRAATRAEVAAFIYQALVSSGQATAIASPYIVGQTVTPPQTQTQLPTGTVIATGYEKSDKILLSLEEPKPVPLTLTVARDITASNGIVLIPRNSQVVGELRIIKDQGRDQGAQFYAQELVLADGSRLPMAATSGLVTKTEEVRRGANTLEILAGTAVGAGAAAAVAAVTGDRAIATEEVLGGSALGALASIFLGRNRVTLISIDPNTDLNVQLTSPLTVR